MRGNRYAGNYFDWGMALTFGIPFALLLAILGLAVFTDVLEDEPCKPGQVAVTQYIPVQSGKVITPVPLTSCETVVK